jgi:hypothetical protein
MLALLPAPAAPVTRTAEPSMHLTPACRPITAAEFAQLRKGARVLEQDRRGEKVLLTPDNHIIKLFYPRRRISSALVYPYAYRFWNNAKRLHARGINTIRCDQLRYDKANRRHLIVYPLLTGSTLRDCLTGGECNAGSLAKLAGFLAGLHARGILFRSIHLGNILVLENGEFGLIDIADMQIRPWRLGLYRRARNFRHLLHDPRDREILRRHGYARFLAAYEAASGLSGYRSRLLRTLVGRYAPAFTSG